MAIAGFVNSARLASLGAIIQPPSNSKPSMPEQACQHRRTRLVAKDKDAQYVECLDCGEVIEVGVIAPKEPNNLDESLSDA